MQAGESTVRAALSTSERDTQARIDSMRRAMSRTSNDLAQIQDNVRMSDAVITLIGPGREGRVPEPEDTR
jgi:hypothetical protein